MSDGLSRREFVGATVGAGIGLTLLGGAEAPAVAADDLPPRTLLVAPPLRKVPEWVRNGTRPSHLPPPDWKMIEAHLKAGVTSLATNMDSRYPLVGPSASLYKPEVVAEADETMRRYVKRVHDAGARAVFYIGPVHVPYHNPEFKKAHPDWMCIGLDGSPGELASFRTGYGDWLAEQLAYVTRTYRPDGFWFDGYSGWQYSRDEVSRKLYREHSGGNEIPTGINPKDPDFQEYLLWFWQGYVDFADRLRGVIRKENPDAVIFANYSSCREWIQPNTMVEYPAAYANAVDIPSLEQYWDNPGDAIHQQFNAAFLGGVSHSRGASIWMQPQAFGIAGLSPEVEFRLRYLTGTLWGVYCEFVESTGREEYVTMWSADMKAREAWMAESEPLPWIGVVASEQTKMRYGQPPALIEYVSHPYGAFRALMESHRPTQILTEYDLEANELQGVKVLVLPNVACLSDRAAEVIRRFVRGGGGLVATYETSLYDHAGARRPDFALADVFHASYVSSQHVGSRDDRIACHVAAKHAITDDPIFDKSGWTGWTPSDDVRYGRLDLLANVAKTRASADAEVVVAYREQEFSKERIPAAIASRYGKGRVVYLPASVDKAMFFYPAGWERRLIRNACDWAAGGPPPVEVEAPMILATTVRTQREHKRVVVHLLNDASSWGRHSLYQHIAEQPNELRDPKHPLNPEMRGTWPVREETIPIHSVKVTCRVPGVKSAKLQPEDLALALKPVAGGVEVTVPVVELHSMVVFEA